MKALKLLFLPGLAVLLAGSLVLGPNETIAADDDEKELPPSGTLSTNRIGGAEGVAVDGSWGEQQPFQDNPNPISGSVSRLNSAEWVMKVYNNTEDKYSVNLEVLQFDKRNKKLKSNVFSYTLKPGESRQRNFRARPGTEQCSLKLRSWKNLTPPKKEESAAEPEVPAK